MHRSTPMSPLARTVLTRIDSVRAVDRVRRRRVLLVVAAAAVLAGLAWTTYRGRIDAEESAAGTVRQVRPAIPLTPARRIDGPRPNLSPPADAPILSTTSR